MDEQTPDRRTLLGRAIAVMTAWDDENEGLAMSVSVVAHEIDDDGTSLNADKALGLIEGLVNLAGVLLARLEIAEQRSGLEILQELALRHNGDN